MNAATAAARATIKAINRKARRGHFMGPWIGWDFATWSAYYPQTASVYCHAATQLVGHVGRFMPPRYQRTPITSRGVHW